MGTDVHAAFHYQATNEATGLKEWQFCEHSYEGNRHYQLFGWIANVRNGYGFAGVDTGDAIKPVAEPRGLPDDCIYWPEPKHEYEYNDPAWLTYWKNGGSEYGDHSFTWLTSTEILNSAKELEGVRKRGVITLKEFLRWDKVTPLESYNSGTYNGVTLKADNVTKHHIEANKYREELLTQLKGYGRNFKTRFVKEPARPKRSLMDSFQTTFGLESYPTPNKPTELVWVAKHKDNMRPARRKHVRKLERYAKRIKPINVKCEWLLDGDYLRSEFAYFTDEVQRLHDLHGEVRFVVGFDS